jgi:zinc-binding alcohol dehydrogenase family protein
MKAVGIFAPLPATDPASLQNIDLPDPRPGARDLLVEVRAVSVNPVDTKVRRRKADDGQPLVLGWDAAGVVRAVGAEVTLFKPGDEVFYAGAINRPGTNAELHLVDERIVGSKPRSLDFAEAAAMPLTAITAWEMLFSRMNIPRGGGDDDTILIMAGAGGVGSIATQLARQLTGLTVVASASRPETEAFARAQGAHAVVDHSRPLAEQFRAQGLDAPRYIFSTSSTARDLAQFIDLIEPQGVIGAIDDADAIDVMPLKPKSLTFAWEFMFTRPVRNTRDMIEQHHLLQEVADMLDAGTLRTTLTERVAGINAANVRAAHEKLERGTMVGKLVLEGF